MFEAASASVLGLRALAVQQRLLGADAANLGTPGFAAEVLNVGQAVAAQQAGLPARTAARVLPMSTSANGNGVSLTTLMVQVGETQQWYAADARLATLAYGRLSTVIGTAPLP